MMTSSKPTKKWSALLATGAVAVALAVSACGGSTNAPSSAGGGSGAHTAGNATVAAKPATTSAPAAPKPATTSAPAGIPQNNGGDQDADNNGGPSDGDGNI